MAISGRSSTAALVIRLTVQLQSCCCCSVPFYSPADYQCLPLPVSFPFDMFVSVVSWGELQWGPLCPCWLYRPSAAAASSSSPVSSHLRMAIILIRHHYRASSLSTAPLAIWLICLIFILSLSLSYFPSLLPHSLPHLNWSTTTTTPSSLDCLFFNAAIHQHCCPLMECLCNRVK